MSTPQNWSLVAHIIGIIYWLGGLIVAAQIMVQLGKEGSSEAGKALADFENKLLKRIVHPGAAVTVLAGIAILVISPDYLRQTWLHIKLALVVLLIAADLLLTVRFRAWQAGRGEIPGRARLYYGSMAVLLFFIVLLAVLKPFS